MSDNKIFAGSVVQIRTTNTGKEITHLVLSIQAVSEEEAIGFALKEAKDKYPESDGWRDHHVMVSTIPDYWYISL